MQNETFKKILFVCLALLALSGAAYAGVMAYQAVLGQPATISVSGQGKVKYTPDIADVDVSLISKGVDPAKVQQDNDAKMTQIVSYLKGQGIKDEDIKTTSYSLYPEYQQGPNVTNTSVIVGYTLNQGVEFRARDISKVGTIVGGLSQAGANSVGGISFSLSDEKLEALTVQAKQQGIQKAEAELASMKSALGFRSAKLVSVGTSVMYPQPYQASYKTLGMGGADASSVPAPIQAGTGEVTVPVSMTYEIR